MNVGRDVLRLPGTNGPRRFEGGMPRFAISGYTGYGSTEISMPYYRDNDQIQYVLNTTWVKGGHNIRFGGDVVFQGMQHTQPEQGGALGGVRGGFEFGPGRRRSRAARPATTSIPGRRSCSACRPGPGATSGGRRALHDAKRAVQLVHPRSVAGGPETHAVVWHTLGVLPHPPPRGPRPRTLQPRDQHDGNRRHRLRARWISASR